MTRCCVEPTVAARGRPRRLGSGIIRLLLGLAALVAVEGSHQIAWAQDELFVTNAGNNTVTVYARTASSNTAPLRTLQGGATKLSAPTGLAVDSVNNELLVTNADSVTVHSRTASGNTAPLRTLQGAATELSDPFGLAVDSVNNELLVVNASSITVYARTASGNSPPLRTLQGAATELSNPFGLAVDSVNNELLVSNEGTGSITVYARTASSNTAPLRTLQGGATELSFPVGLAVDLVNNELLVTNADSVTVYVRTASGNSPPLRTLQGAATELSNPFGLAVDSVNNELLVVNASSITVYARTASGNTAPLRTLQGAATELSSPQFLAVLRQPFLPPPSSPMAAVALNGSMFHTGQQLTYQATLTPGTTPTRVDIYLGALLPDGVTFLSLVQGAPGAISIILGPAPSPFLTNVTLAPLAVPFNFTFTGPEPVGTYFPFAGLAVAGSNPFISANQLSLAVQSFQYSP